MLRSFLILICFAADAFSKQRASGWADPTGGFIHAMHRARWGGYHYRITGKDSDGAVTYEGGWQNNRQMGMHNDFRMVENIFEELDAPGRLRRRRLLDSWDRPSRTPTGRSSNHDGTRHHGSRLLDL